MQLDDHEDAFGAMLLDAFRGELAYELIERDDGRLDLGRSGQEYLALPRQPDPATREMLDVLDGRVLDVGCGAGRHALALRRRGHEVLGIDISPGALTVARRQGLSSVLQCPISQVDQAPGRFDSILLGGNNFGLMEAAPLAVERLGRLSRLLDRGGRIVATSLDVRQLDDPDTQRYLAQNQARGRMPGQLRLRIRWKQRATPYFDYLMVSPHEMRELAQAAHLRLGRVIPLGGPLYAGVLLPG